MAKKKTAKPPVREANHSSIAQLRREIDRLDHDVLALVNRRAELASQIGEVKRENDQVVYAPDRETQVLATLVSENPGPLTPRAVRSIFREVISGCRELEKTLRVAYLGPEFTYSHLAAIHRFGQSAELVPVATIGAVFEAVEAGQADFGIVPIENSTDGRISDTLLRLSQSKVRLCGEVPLRIHHHLLARGKLTDVRTVYSKPQALSQCRRWLAGHLPHANLCELASTTEAALRAGQEPGAAAVASRQAAVNYELDVLAENIEDDPQNQTRFAAIGHEPAAPTGDDKTSILCELEHRPGALADVLSIIKRKGINMTWIESFPIPGKPGRYLFFIELVGHSTDVRLRRATALLKTKTQRLEILGSYGRSEAVE